MSSKYRNLQITDGSCIEFPVLGIMWQAFTFLKECEFSEVSEFLKFSKRNWSFRLFCYLLNFINFFQLFFSWDWPVFEVAPLQRRSTEDQKETFAPENVFEHAIDNLTVVIPESLLWGRRRRFPASNGKTGSWSGRRWRHYHGSSGSRSQSPSTQQVPVEVLRLFRPLGETLPCCLPSERQVKFCQQAWLVTQSPSTTYFLRISCNRKQETHHQHSRFDSVSSGKGSEITQTWGRLG